MLSILRLVEGASSELLGHLLHQDLNHIDVGNLAVVEVLLYLVQVLLRKTIVLVVSWDRLLVHWVSPLGMVVDTVLFPFDAESKLVVHAHNVFFEIVELLHLGQLLDGQLLHIDGLERLHVIIEHLVISLLVAAVFGAVGFLVLGPGAGLLLLYKILVLR